MVDWRAGHFAAHGERGAYRAFVGVYHLMAAPALLFNPALFLSAALTAMRGMPPAAPRPPIWTPSRRRAHQPRQASTSPNHHSQRLDRLDGVRLGRRLVRAIRTPGRTAGEQHLLGLRRRGDTTIDAGTMPSWASLPWSTVRARSGVVMMDLNHREHEEDQA